MIKYWATYGTAPQRELYEGPDFIQFTTGIPYSLFNGEFLAKLSPDELDAAITVVIHSVAYHKTPCPGMSARQPGLLIWGSTCCAEDL